MVLIRDESGALLGWYGANTDIDDLKQAQMKLVRTRESYGVMNTVPLLDVPAAIRARGTLVRQAVGTVPPSITYSVPVMEPACGEATNAMRSATSRGLAGLPSGMPPSDRMMICLPPS